jgi:DNA-binding MarR family transcriptional regulator
MNKRATTAADLWPLFLTTHAVLVDAIESRLAQARLPPLAWYDALWALERSPERKLRLHEMAQRMVLARSNLTRLVDRLEAAGLVKRERAGDDRRGAYAVLTARGAATRQKMWPVYAKAVGELFEEHLGAGEAQALGTAFSRMLGGRPG